MEMTPAPEPVNRQGLSPHEEAALEIVQEICDASGLDVYPDPQARHLPYLDVELIGEDSMETFGKHGHTLDSLQYLANLIINRRVGPEIRIILDAGGYRARRAQILTRMAQQYAAEVRERQQECELDPLPAHERRIVHHALQGESAIRTYSEGTDPDRRVIIAPA